MRSFEIELIPVSAARVEAIADYRAEFPAAGPLVTPEMGRIPGLDHLEAYDSVEDWLRFCEAMRGKITWYLSVRKNDRRIVGCVCLRHRLEYDDDGGDFASHIGYSVRPGERGKGYAKEQLRLCLQKAKELGLDHVRIICLDSNVGSRKTILANGGVYVDTIRGEESGMRVCRYDILL